MAMKMVYGISGITITLGYGCPSVVCVCGKNSQLKWSSTLVTSFNYMRQTSIDISIERAKTEITFGPSI